MLPGHTAKSLTLRIGILVYPGFEPLDLFGPAEMLASLRHFGKDPQFFTVGARKGRVESVPSLPAFADYNFSDVPHDLDLLLVPGGLGTRRIMRNFWSHKECGQASTKEGDSTLFNEDVSLMQWLKTCILDPRPYPSSVLCVCTGAAMLAGLGILDDCPATTNRLAFEFVRQQDRAGRVQWDPTARWRFATLPCNGGAKQVVTSAGVSAGMDMTLAFIARTYGQRVAEATAERAEYTWQRCPLERDA
mmetsp:Transcript_11289/g.28476  ORF Transcript_11289/g.28476 Transcript_11289/m.28476 type:complete len:247 (-) Transcript_11289:306-1046(-)